MARWQGKLERKQGFLGRIVDIGAELFAIAAACVYAETIAARAPDRAGRRRAELADLFCRQARRRADALFTQLWDNTDAADASAAQRCSTAATRGSRRASSTRRFPGPGSPPPSPGRPRRRTSTATSADTQAAPGTQHPDSWRRVCPERVAREATRQRTTAEGGTAAGFGGFARAPARVIQDRVRRVDGVLGRAVPLLGGAPMPQ